MPNKIITGDQIQIRLNPNELEAKTRAEWGSMYISKQAEKAKMLASAVAFSLASLLCLVVALEFAPIFFIAALLLGYLAVKSFFDFGYELAGINSWESKTMIRMDM